jgi:hypothetical protein
MVNKMITLLVLYALVSYAVGFHLFMDGNDRTYHMWIAWILSPIIVVPAILLLIVAG